MPVSKRDCKHGQLKRSCNLCLAAIDIEESFKEGFYAALHYANLRPLDVFYIANEAWGKSQARIEADCT